MLIEAVTSEFEILRGDMALIFYNATKSTQEITYIFDETVTAIEEPTPGKVNVTFANHTPPTTYDLVVGADGMLSRTRRLVFGHGPDNNEFLNRLGQYSAYFTIPRTEEDTNHGEWWNAPGGLLILKRPDQYGNTHVYLGVTDSNLSRFDEIDAIMKNKGVEEQKAWFAKVFEGAGWQTERVIRGMNECKDFYMQQIGQVKMDNWSKGHVVLVGDAAFCPSPISGVVSFVLFHSHWPPVLTICSGNWLRYHRYIRSGRRALQDLIDK
jgi:2-polyprenyl-6-methoxyphenol hydroxylase-like FAD-dependent oxidoreductase